MKKRKGFTLIELVIVTTIMMMLSVAGLVNYSAVNRKNRDEKRKADLQKMVTTLEIQYQAQGYYPANVTLPTDPRSQTGYSYIYRTGGGNTPFSYELLAHMEDLGSTNGNYNYLCISQHPSSCNYRIKSY